MINYLEYGLDNKMQLTASVPTIAYDRAMSESRLPEVIEGEAQLVSVNSEKGGVLLTLNHQWFKEEERDVASAEAGASQWLYALTSTRKFTPDELVNPDLDVQMMQSSTGDLSGQSRLGFRAKLTWPLNNYEMSQKLATLTMRETARTFGYLEESIIDSAFASVDHEHGVLLQALNIGCCCVSTDGMVFKPEAKQIQLSGHNLYNRQVMLTCFTGLVTLARLRKIT